MVENIEKTPVFRSLHKNPTRKAFLPCIVHCIDRLAKTAVHKEKTQKGGFCYISIPYKKAVARSGDGLGYVYTYRFFFVAGRNFSIIQHANARKNQKKQLLARGHLYARIFLFFFHLMGDFDKYCLQICNFINLKTRLLLLDREKRKSLFLSFDGRF